MARHTPLRDGHPKNLRQDGTVVFRIVLRQARREREILSRLIEAGRLAAYPSRAAFVRAAMEMVREKIGEARAYWSVENVPTYVYERQRVEHASHVWHEAVYVGRITPVAADLREAA